MAEMTLDQQRAVAMAQARLRLQEQESAPQSAPADKSSTPASMFDRALSGVRNFAADKIQENIDMGSGLLRGAGSIGATIAALYDVPSDYLAGKGLTLESNRQRRSAMDSALQTLFGANPQSGAYQIGKIGGEVAGTAGVGGVLANGARAAGAAPSVVTALQTGGLSAGAGNAAVNLATRVGAGAVTGGAAAGMVNPEDAGTGAAIGGALPVVQKAASAIVSGLRHLIGTQTGAGEAALQTAYKAGKAGGSAAEALKENMRGRADITQVLDDARANLATMRAARSAEYQANMAPVRASTAVIDMTPIERSVQNSIKQFTFKGQAKDPKVLEKLQEVEQVVADWKSLDPAQYHTAEGLDALKQRIGAIKESVPFEATAVRKAIGQVYTDVWNNIQSKAPEYAKAMKGYEMASGLMDEIERSLSLGLRSTADTAMRKLQSVLRNNVQTNYGARVAAVNALEQQGGRELMPALAGQALNQWTPRGMQRAVGTGLVGGLTAMGNVPAAVGIGAMSSPRLMGEAAFLSGQLSNPAGVLGELLYRSAPVLGSQLTSQGPIQ